MYATINPHLMLTLHRSHAEALWAEAEAERLARSIRQRRERRRTWFWLVRRDAGIRVRQPKLP